MQGRRNAEPTCFPGRGSTLKVMSAGHAFELPEHGAGGLDDAVAEAAAGETVYLTRGGRPVAAVVPTATAEVAAQRQAAADAVVADMVGWAGGQAPGLEHYRRVYAATGTPWPGDDQVRQLYPVQA